MVSQLKTVGGLAHCNGRFLTLCFLPQPARSLSKLPFFGYNRCTGFFSLRPCQARNRICSLRGNLEATGVPTSVPVCVAHELLQGGHRYLDVRTPEEFITGHAPGAVNIPYMYKVGSGFEWKKSMIVATDLLAFGYRCITDIAGGYAAWTQNALPTEL